MKMISHFPTPYPDELLYSICARYTDRVQYPAVASVNLELFGARHFVAAVDLPSHINALTSRLPPSHRLTSERIIDENTLLPFYSPFLPPERVDRIREAMKSPDGKAISKISGITPSIIRPPERLQFCPTCVVEDRRKSRGAYWHRLHQIPGVKVCPVHNAILETSNVHVRTLNEYIPAERAVINNSPRLIDANAPHYQVLLEIAQNAKWLLEQRGLVPGSVELRKRYVYLLIGKGLANINHGRVIGAKLLKAIHEYYPHSVLQSLQCDFDSQEFNKWPLVFVKGLNINNVHHPLRHLLMIQLLSQTTESFFKLTEPEYFGKGPWPCNNPVCAHYQKPKISRYQIKLDRSKSQTKLVGVFECDCGYSYTCKVQPPFDESTLIICSVERYGRIWEEALRRLWNDSSVSLKEISRRLLRISSTESIKRQAAYLGLPFPRKGPGKPSHEIPSGPPSTKPRVGISYTISECRKEWKEILSIHPNSTRTYLRSNFGAIYQRLEEKDKKWLERHLPSKALPGNRRVINWPKRDSEIAKAIRPLVIKLKASPARPVRITKQLIFNKLGRVNTLSKQLQKLPLTAQVLCEVVETRVEFALRRLRWAADCFLRENRRPSRSDLVLRACFGSDLWENPTIKLTIESLWQSLQNQETILETKVA